MKTKDTIKKAIAASLVEGIPAKAIKCPILVNRSTTTRIHAKSLDEGR